MKQILLIVLIILLIGCDSKPREPIAPVSLTELIKPIDPAAQVSRMGAFNISSLSQMVKDKCYPEIKQDIQNSINKFGYLSEKDYYEIHAVCLEVRVAKIHEKQDREIQEILKM